MSCLRNCSFYRDTFWTQHVQIHLFAVECFQALVYPFKLSSEGYRFDTTFDVGRKSKLVRDKYV